MPAPLSSLAQALTPTGSVRWPLLDGWPDTKHGNRQNSPKSRWSFSAPPCLVGSLVIHLRPGLTSPWTSAVGSPSSPRSSPSSSLTSSWSSSSGGILYVTTGSLVVDFYTNALSSDTRLYVSPFHLHHLQYKIARFWIFNSTFMPPLVDQVLLQQETLGWQWPASVSSQVPFIKRIHDVKESEIKKSKGRSSQRKLISRLPTLDRCTYHSNLPEAAEQENFLRRSQRAFKQKK